MRAGRKQRMMISGSPLRIESNQTYPTREGNAYASEDHPVNEGPESVHEKHAGGDHERDQRSQDPCFDSIRVIHYTKFLSMLVVDLPLMSASAHSAM